MMEDNTATNSISVPHLNSIEDESSCIRDEILSDVSPEELAAQLENDDQEKRYRDWRKIGKSIYRQHHALLAMSAFINEDNVPVEKKQENEVPPPPVITKQLGPQVTPGEPVEDDESDEDFPEEKGRLNYRSVLRKTNVDPEDKSTRLQVEQIDLRGVLKPSPSKEKLMGNIQFQSS